MAYAPIVVFGFNRPNALKNTIASLLQNEEAKQSDLFIFVDGPREGRVGEEEKVEIVRDYVKSIAGFKSLHYVFAERNKGLANSIIEGVSEVINKFGRVIVLEDDLSVQPNFLAFMNQGLEKYGNVEKIFSIGGYTNKLKIPTDYQADAFVYNDSTSWGWATWKDRWETIDWKLEPFDDLKKYKSAFNKWLGSDAWRMLSRWHKGEIKSWSIRFNFAQFLQDRPAMAPVYSLVANDGFDGNGTNCKAWSRFKYELEPTGKKNFIWPDDLKIDDRLRKQAVWYSSIPIRIFSRIMYIVYPLIKRL